MNRVPHFSRLKIRERNIVQLPEVNAGARAARWLHGEDVQFSVDLTYLADGV